jgi:hypothetical protein
VLKRGHFQKKYELSTTAMAMDIADSLDVQEVMFTGYDGYTGQVTRVQLELFEENQQIFDDAEEQGLTIFSITPTMYKLSSKSIFMIL